MELQLNLRINQEHLNHHRLQSLQEAFSMFKMKFDLQAFGLRLFWAFSQGMDF
jgi:hypothetical protein